MECHMKCFALTLFLTVVHCSPRPQDDKQNQETLQRLQKFLTSNEFDNIFLSKYMELQYKIETCIKLYGANASYDMNKRTCFVCGAEDCADDTVCAAQCRDLLRISQLEANQRRTDDRITDLNRKFAVALVFGCFSFIFGVILILVECFKCYKAYDRREQLEFDLISQKEERVENSREDVTPTAPSPPEERVFVEAEVNDEGRSVDYGL
uniref:uncharacterized protein LOC120344543 isoform X2 n=1 Tax=Styela clava TaxID=7725 RepID=UPI00193A1171|nr:uncharacterized protein LOC120344543 isoform X2 [Styela clava]